MKTIKNYLYLLLAGTFVLFSACEETGETVAPADLNAISTYSPTIEGDNVTFNGNLKNANSTIEYGFMWYVQPSGQEEAVVHRLVVGNGDINGDFTKVVANLPKGVSLVVCAFVDYKDATQQVINAIGEEIDFTYD
ncbi:MAG: hypothetical protein HEP71_14230 [Roseivirga sp.]|nr:hypothetical protein [Roseivirga sp.]